MDAWTAAHPRDVLAIVVMLFVGGLAWGLTSFQTETHDKLDALEKQLDSIARDSAELKSDLRDLKLK